MKLNHRQGWRSGMTAMLLTLLVAVVMFAGATHAGAGANSYHARAQLPTGSAD